MSSSKERLLRPRLRLILVVLLVSSMAGCTTPFVEKKSQRVEDVGPEAALTYYHGLTRMTSAELGREKMVLVAVPQTPFTQVRLAMLLGYSRVQQDLPRAQGLLENVLKSTDPTAIALQPLARLLSDNYVERSKLESQQERQGQLLKESQRKATELQEKLDSLADIERTLTPRPRSFRSDGVRR